MSKTTDTLRLGAARTVGIVVQLVSVPIVWDILGADLLGVCYFLIIVGRWVSLLDIGYGDGAQRLMTRAFDSDDGRKGFSVYQTHVVLLLVHAAVGFAVFALLGQFVEIPNLPNGTATGPLFLAGASVFAAQYLFQGTSVYFNARRQFKYLAVANGSQYLISGLLALGLTIWLRRPEAYLAGFAIGAGCVVLANLACGLMQARKVAERQIFDKEAFRYSFGFGARLYLTKLSSVTVGTIDRLAIMDVLGPGQLTAYTNAARIPEAASQTFPLNQTLLPDYTRAHMEGGKQFASQVERSTRISLMVGCGLILVPCAFGGPVLQLWLQEKFVPEMAIVMLLIGVFRAFEVFFSGIAQVFLAHGTPQRVTFLMMAHLLLVLLFIYPAVRIYGLVGVAA
ncbi:MAG: oligosaccharide flippase family protein, partial [Armatimonadetes bacterium]|nr:oligosaccharide flippase family protein [Armatimonadota bacterium]